MGSIVDQDARVGHKSKTEHFLDIKQNNHNNRRSNHYSSKVNNGAYVDGTNFEELMERTQRSGVTIKELLEIKHILRNQY